MKEKNKKDFQEEVTFHYLKSNDFKTVFSTGIIGGITINSKINLDFYIDRVIIPISQTHKVENNKLGDLNTDKSVSKSGVVREIQTGVLMEPGTAKAVADWIYQQLKLLENESN